MKKIIAVTMGDPHGVGSEIILKSFQNKRLFEIACPVVIGDYNYLRYVKKHILNRSESAWPHIQQVPYPTNHIQGINPAHPFSLKVIDFKNIDADKIKFGMPTALAGKASGVYIKEGIRLAMNQEVHGLVTMPINKYSFRMGGWGKKYIGHTEMIKRFTRSKHVAMMMTNPKGRIVFVTSHVPLKKVASHITSQSLKMIFQLTFENLKRMKIKFPRVAVSALNPHAGENGLLGREELEIISPLISKFKKKGCHIEGPIPGDIIWGKVFNGEYDAGIAMYHDQGQIPIKLWGFENGVNLTLGTPIIRTSPVHGTAYDIAGKGKAKIDSFVSAYKMAAQLAVQ